MVRAVMATRFLPLEIRRRTAQLVTAIAAPAIFLCAGISGAQTTTETETVVQAAAAPAPAPAPVRKPPAEANAGTLSPEVSPAGICEKIFVIGASASNGFCIEEMRGGPKTGTLLFSRYPSAALKVPHTPVRTAATRFMLLNLEPPAEFQIAEAQKARPSVVVAMDFLFWFCYGRVEREDQRLPRLEDGLTIPPHSPVRNPPMTPPAKSKVLSVTRVFCDDVCWLAHRRPALENCADDQWRPDFRLSVCGVAFSIV